MLPREDCVSSLDVRTWALGLVVGIALGLMWQQAPTDRLDIGAGWAKGPPTPTGGGKAAVVRRHLSATKSNAALSAALKSPHVIEALQEELPEETSQSSIAIFCVVHMFGHIQPDFDLIVNASWGRHCDHLLFVSNNLDRARIGLTMYVEERSPTKACLVVLRYLQELEDDAVDDVNWFLWTSVHSFVIVENLRHVVEGLDPSEPSYLGPLWSGARSLRPLSNTTFVVNRAALNRIARTNCSSFRTIVRCVNTAGVKVVDSRDERGCERFFKGGLGAGCLPFRNAFTPSLPAQQRCLSTTFVSVHAHAHEMLVFEYLTHVLAAYGQRARLNVTDARVPWNASAMPAWSDQELRLIHAWGQKTIARVANHTTKRRV
ncbi:glycoprotein-N-acetylgalactosamine 3-beta-galactosyltransferase 1-like [Dermacentor albipictus]|uniref:glycoprotein-N-acetylgalactosamine 3-beta-galactosyltransferase 1-like n=1 Tax=Dermacentor albipictus TaxID=60249 RepID=UPI0031FC6770